MRPEAIEPDGAHDKADISRSLAIEYAAPGSQGREPRRKGRFWVSLVLAGISTALLCVLGSLLINDLPEQIAGFLLIAVIFPAAMICEKLGFGHFSILGSSTIPDWLFFCVMIVLVYLYSLIVVVIGRLLVRVLRA
jgi:hypothetical protein